MISEAERRAQIRITRAFRDADVELIELIRQTPRTQNAAGGWDPATAVTLAPQALRLIPQEDGATERVTAEGESATPQYILLGMPDSDMQRWDEFVSFGRRMQIVYIDNRGYERKGEVVFLGD